MSHWVGDILLRHKVGLIHRLFIFCLPHPYVYLIIDIFCFYLLLDSFSSDDIFHQEFHQNSNIIRKNTQWRIWSPGNTSLEKKHYTGNTTLETLYWKHYSKKQDSKHKVTSDRGAADDQETRDLPPPQESYITPDNSTSLPATCRGIPKLFLDSGEGREPPPVCIRQMGSNYLSCRKGQSGSSIIEFAVLES